MQDITGRCSTTIFDAAGHGRHSRKAVEGISVADGSRVTWLYDANYKLTGENRTGTSAYRNTFTYDSRGNRTLKNEGGSRTTCSYDAANQLRYGQAAVGRATYTFDANENQVVERTRTTTDWDFNRRSISCRQVIASP